MLALSGGDKFRPEVDPQADFFTFMAGLSKFMVALRLNRKTAVKVFFG